MALSRVAVVGALVALLCSTASAAFLRIDTHHATCFAEEVGHRSEVVVVEYERIANHLSDAMHVQITVTSPRSKSVVHSGLAKSGTNTFTFRPLATEEGEYDICFMSPGHMLLGKGVTPVDIRVLIDHHDRSVPLPEPDPTITRKRVQGSEVMSFTDANGNQMDTLRSVEFIEEVTKMLHDVGVTAAEVRGEVTYFEARALRMRQTSEAIFERIWLLSALTTIAIGIVSYIQFSFLTNFLRRKKLV